MKSRRPALAELQAEHGWRGARWAVPVSVPLWGPAGVAQPGTACGHTSVALSSILVSVKLPFPFLQVFPCTGYVQL